MQAVTFGQIDNKVRKDLDLQDDQNFIGYDEMAGYANEGIDAAEALIHKIDEDYFLTKSTLSLVDTESDLVLPTTLYAQKIRGLIYKNADRIYPVKRLRDPHSFFQQALINNQVNNTEEYQYFLRLDAGTSQAVIELTPPAYESGAFLTCWFIRNAARVPLIEEGSTRAAQISTVVDIPEFRAVVEQYMKMRCFEKMRDAVAVKDAKENIVALSKLMEDTLTNRVPDRDDEVPQDTSHYQEHN